jgi:hypothetical protein
MKQVNSTDSRPPAPPWCEIRPRRPEGYLSYYLADGLSGFPVRAVTLPNNNKSDPNIETKTYGLFSTCAHGMRASVVKQHYGFVVFITRQHGERVVTGYYRLRWYAPGALVRVPPDFALAADRVRFVYPAIRPSELPSTVSEVVKKPFRIFKHIAPETLQSLVEALEERSDATDEYLAEIDRLERYNQFHTGYRYPTWKLRESFSWQLAPRYLHTGSGAQGKRALASTSSPNDAWDCSACGAVVHNKALLKRCPECGGMDSLRPTAA